MSSRRTFVKGLAFGGAAASLGLLPLRAAAEPGARADAGVLEGTEFDLRIGQTRVNVTGRERVALTINGSLPGPLLRWREGDTVTLRVSNALDDHTSIHWHGILLPANMDGVPGLSFDGIRPGATWPYRFRVRQAGTYWYHSHAGFQEQRGVYGPLVIVPREPEPFRYDREHVVMLTDWTDEDPRHVFGRLKKQSDYYNIRQRTLGDLVRDVKRDGLGATFAERRAWAAMRMNPTNLADVGGATYTYLMNGQPPAGNWTGLFTAGERVRLRLINGSAMSYFDVRIPGVKLTVVAADGQPVRPVTVDELRIAVAETYDVIVEPQGAEAFTIMAQAMDRIGFAAGTLATREGLRAELPPPDPRPVLTMADMGHAHDSEHDPDNADHSATAQDPHAGHAGHGAVTHPLSESGNPLVDMQSAAPRARLDDPGIGLRGNGRRVLTYADLSSAFDDPDGREPSHGRTGADGGDCMLVVGDDRHAESRRRDVHVDRAVVTERAGGRHAHLAATQTLWLGVPPRGRGECGRGDMVDLVVLDDHVLTSCRSEPVATRARSCGPDVGYPFPARIAAPHGSRMSHSPWMSPPRASRTGRVSRRCRSRCAPATPDRSR